MVAILGLVLGAGVLWLWLTGHWFGRVLAFLLFAVVFGTLGSLAAENAGPGAAKTAWLGGLAGIAAAWFAAAGPRYYRRARIKRMQEEREAENIRLTREAAERFNKRHGLICGPG